MKTTIILKGKKYIVEIKNNKPFIDGQSADEFVETINDPELLLDLTRIGIKKIKDDINKIKDVKYQDMMNNFEQHRMN